MNRPFAVRLGDVAEINPKASRTISDDDAVAFVPMAAVSEEGRLEHHETRPYREVRKGYSYFERGDVLIAKITPCFENGKAALTSDLREQVGFGSTEFHVLRPGPNLDAKYLFYALWNERFRVSAASGMTGSAGQKRVPADLLRRTEIRLPPLDEQRRIAAILDKANALRHKRKRAIALLDGLTRSIFFEMFGDPVLNPKGLLRRPLGDLIRVKSGEGLTSAQMDQNGPYTVYGGNGPNGHHSSFMFAEPKVVVGRVGVYCGAVHITSPNSWVTDNALYVSENYEDLDMDYLASALQIANLNQLAGRAAQPLISGGRIYPVEILVPAKADQRRFAAALAKVRQLRSQADAEGTGSLFASLQHRAFSGQL